MFYHVYIRRHGKDTILLLNLTRGRLENHIIRPYCSESVIHAGKEQVPPCDIRSLRIKSTDDAIPYDTRVITIRPRKGSSDLNAVRLANSGDDVTKEFIHNRWRRFILDISGYDWRNPFRKRRRLSTRIRDALKEAVDIMPGPFRKPTATQLVHYFFVALIGAIGGHTARNPLPPQPRIIIKLPDEQTNADIEIGDFIAIEAGHTPNAGSSSGKEKIPPSHVNMGSSPGSSASASSNQGPTKPASD